MGRKYCAICEYVHSRGQTTHLYTKPKDRPLRKPMGKRITDKEPRFRYPMWLECGRNASMTKLELHRERQAFREGWNARGRAERRRERGANA